MDTVAKISGVRHEQFLGKSYDEIDNHIQNGYMIGYQQAVNDLSQVLNIPLKDLIVELKKIC